MYDDGCGHEYNPQSAEDRLLTYRLIKFRVNEVGRGEVSDSGDPDSPTWASWRIEVPTVDPQWSASGALSAVLAISGDKASPQGVEARYPVWLQLSTGGISEEPYSVAVAAESPIPYLRIGVGGIVGFLTQFVDEVGEDLHFEPDVAVARRREYSAR